MGEVYAHYPVGEVLAADAVLPGKNNLQRMTYYRGVTQSHAHHKNMLTAETSAAPTATGVWTGVAAVETDSMAAAAAVAADTVQIDTMSTTKRGIQEPYVSGLGTRSHRLSHGDHQMRQGVVAVGNMDVRMRSLTREVGEEQRDGENRRGGDACDSLGLVYEEGLGHRKHVLGMVVWVRAWGSLAAVEVGS